MPRRAALWTLGVFTAINLLNYLDRFVIAPLLQQIKGEMGLSDAQLGWLVTAFMIVYVFAAPVFGAWGDRRSRTHAVALGVGLWSIATCLAGFAHGYGHLLAARALVGIGEAAFVAIAAAMLADLFPAPDRARVYAVLNMAIPVGSALGYILGGLIGHRHGWRAAFFVAGAPGLLLAAAALWLKDPPRGAQDRAPAAAAVPAHSPLARYWSLLRRGPYMLVVLGYAAYTFALGGLAFWMPAFLERVRGIPMEQASVSFGEIVVITGFIGTFAGGWIADFLLRYSRQAYLWFSGAATLLAAPAAYVALSAQSHPVYMGALIVAELLMFMSTGPINAAIVNVVSPLERASAVALSMMAIHLLGDVPSPPLIGYVSDQLGSLAHAVLIVPVAILIGGLVWLLAAHRNARVAAAR
ncbi:MAG: MFS transporter [Proteobacteria bacterium]|nr:MFS transporter [Pseudomonadota bacterium]